MAWGPKCKATLPEDLDHLLGDLCVEWGFCNRLDGKELIRRNWELTPSAFAAAVLTAEGMNPELERAWRRKLEAKFAERYGRAVSPESYSVLPD
jgi:hypothetical protein